MKNDNKLRFDCSMTGNILAPSSGIGLSCKVKDGDANAGDINIVYSRVNGENKVNLDVDKELIFKLASDAINVDRLIEKFGNLLL